MSDHSDHDDTAASESPVHFNLEEALKRHGARRAAPQPPREVEPYIMRLHSLRRGPLPAPCEQCSARTDALQAIVDELIEWAATAYSRQLDLELKLDDVQKKIAPPLAPFVVSLNMS